MAMSHCLSSSFGPQKTKFEIKYMHYKKFISDNENINLKIPAFSGKATCPIGQARQNVYLPIMIFTRAGQVFSLHL
jgi:hypothetical protein